MSYTIYFYNDTERYIGISNNEENLFRQLPDKLNCNKMSCKISLNTPTNTYGMNDCEYILVKNETNYILYEFGIGLEKSMEDPCVECKQYILTPQKMTKVSTTPVTIKNVINKEYHISGDKNIEKWCLETYDKIWSELRIIDQRTLRDIYNVREKIITDIPGYIPSIIDIWAYEKVICYKIEKGNKRKVEPSEIIKVYGNMNFLYTKYNNIYKYIVSSWWKLSEKIHKKKMCPVHLFPISPSNNRYDMMECMVCGNDIPILINDEEVPLDCICHIKYNRDNFYILHI